MDDPDDMDDTDDHTERLVGVTCLSVKGPPGWPDTMNDCEVMVFKFSHL